METYSALLAICTANSPVPGEFPSQRPVTRHFDVFFDLRLNKRLGKQSWGWWFETLSHPLWHQCNWLTQTTMNRYVGYSRRQLLSTNEQSYTQYNDVIMSAMASQNTNLRIVYSTVYSGTDQRKHQSSESFAFVWGINRWPVNSPHKWPVTRKMFPFVDVIMIYFFISIVIRVHLLNDYKNVTAVWRNLHTLLRWVTYFIWFVHTYGQTYSYP